MAGESSRDQVRIPGVFNATAKLCRHDHENSAFKPGHQTPVRRLVEQTAGKSGSQAGNFLNLSQGERRLRAVVERG